MPSFEGNLLTQRHQEVKTRRLSHLGLNRYWVVADGHTDSIAIANMRLAVRTVAHKKRELDFIRKATQWIKAKAYFKRILLVGQRWVKLVVSLERGVITSSHYGVYRLVRNFFHKTAVKMHIFGRKNVKFQRWFLWKVLVVSYSMCSL